MSNPVEKALWFIENNLESEISMDEIAQAAGVTRFHLSRQFSMSTGLSIMRYARARRLSIAATALMKGAADILTVALDAGYGSHEAFSRAFREHFGVTPESVRSDGAATLKLTEPKRMSTQSIEIAKPRFEQSAPILVTGLGARYNQGGDAGIPLQWQRFVRYLGSIPTEVSGVTYGVAANFDDEDCFDYIAGVEVKSFTNLPEGFTALRIPQRRYAVFTHAGHVSGIPSVMRAIWTDWLPNSGHRFADAPFFERYDRRFNPVTGAGEIELWLPIE